MALGCGFGDCLMVVEVCRCASSVLVGHLLLKFDVNDRKFVQELLGSFFDCLAFFRILTELLQMLDKVSKKKCDLVKVSLREAFAEAVPVKEEHIELVQQHAALLQDAIFLVLVQNDTTFRLAQSGQCSQKGFALACWIQFG